MEDLTKMNVGLAGQESSARKTKLDRFRRVCRQEHENAT